MALNIQQIDGVTVIAPVDSIDIDSSEELRDAILSEKENGSAALVLDLADVHYVDSSGLSALVAVANAFDRDGRKMLLSGVDPAVLQILQLTRLDEFFRLVNDREAALTALAAPSPESA